MNLDDEWTVESWGWTVLSSYSWSVSEQELELDQSSVCWPVQQEAPSSSSSSIMSRRSLRLHSGPGLYADEGPLVDRHSMSLNIGVGRDDRSKGRRSHRPMNGVQSLLVTPQKSQCGSAPGNTSLLSCAPSDASLLSSLIDESCIQENTHMDSFWGLDGEGENQLDQTILAGGGDVMTAQTQTSVMKGVTCRDCSFQETSATSTSTATSTHPSSHRHAPSSFHRHASSSSSSKPPAPSSYRQPGYLAAASSSSSAAHHYTSSSSAAAAAGGGVAPPHGTTVYSRDKARKQRPGVLLTVSEVCVAYGRRAAASVACVLSLLAHALLQRSPAQGKDERSSSVAQACVRACRRAWLSALRASGPVLTALRHRVALSVSRLHAVCAARMARGKADWRYCATSMNGDGHAEHDGHGDAGASLSKGSWSAWKQLLGLMWLVRDFLVLRCLPNLYRLLLLLLPLLLLVVFCYCSPASLWAVLPVVNMTNWRASSLLHPAHWDTPLEEASASHHYAPPPPSPAHQPSTSPPPPPVVDPERVVRMDRVERSLAQLWERVARGEQRQQQQNAELLALYRPLQERVETMERADGGAIGGEAEMSQLSSELKQWTEALVEQRLQPLHEEMERSTHNNTQHHQRLVSQQQGYQTRMVQLEALLEALAHKTEDVQKAQESMPAPIIDAVDKASHEALLQEVQRLEAALANIREDLQGIMGCQGRCQHLDNIPNMVSAQVKAELHALFYGSDGDVEVGAVPDSLLPWLSARFVTGSDLRASLAELEQGILGNVSRLVAQSERRQQQAINARSLRASVGHATSGTGLSEEHVELIVKNALKLYSQDRTGMVDYALESGGGSILSTRCSETFETQTALMSLFGIPLWYFTQSPRVVIQPDVQPGKCWAFKGSHGYLVMRLSTRVLPTAFSLEHIPKTLSPSGHINSAPKDYAVYGLEHEREEQGKLLGRYTYQEDGDALQTNTVMEENDQLFQIIELRVLSNWGNPEYTCLYRFRVHGQPSTQ
ncbi:SUN domain-containing protein 1 [Engraulis encrasicolus]|uniref:SUN domain-containing protein 1 n=1 Tax=Engraulis encrasicolus TaxID=184585 RepID=UPI002FD5EA70